MSWTTMNSKLTPSEQLRRKCKLIYPQEYRDNAHVIYFSQLPSNLSMHIHQYRDLDDLEVPLPLIMECLGMSSERADNHLVNLELKALANRLDPSVGEMLPFFRLCDANRSLEQYLNATYATLPGTSLNTVWQNRDLLLLCMYWRPGVIFQQCSFDLAMELEQQGKCAIEFVEAASDLLRKRLDDKTVALMMILYTYESLSSRLAPLSPRLCQDRGLFSCIFTIGAITGSAINWFRQADREIMEDRAFLKWAIAKRPYLLGVLNKTFRSDKELVLHTVRQKGQLLEIVDEHLQEDPQIVYAAVQNDGYALRFAHPRFWTERPCVLLAAQSYNPLAFADNFNDDEEIVIASMRFSPLAFTMASERIQKDRHLLKLAISKTGAILEVLPIEWRKDKEIVSLAVRSAGHIFRIVDVKLQNDREVVMIAVEDHGMALEHANVRFRDDEEVVMTAVQKGGLALQFANVKFQKNRDIVFLAVQSNGNAIEFASPEFLSDVELLCIALDAGWFLSSVSFETVKNNRYTMLRLVSRRPAIWVVASSSKLLAIVAVWKMPSLCRYQNLIDRNFSIWFSVLLMIFRGLRMLWQFYQGRMEGEF